MRRPSANILEQDELLGDPVATQIGGAIAVRHWPRALELSRLLVQKHPKNGWVRCLHAQVAAHQKRYPEAMAARHEAVRIRPKFEYGYLQLGAMEVVQQHFGQAIPHFKKLVELDPQAAIGWVFLSGCTETRAAQGEP